MLGIYVQFCGQRFRETGEAKPSPPPLESLCFLKIWVFLHRAQSAGRHFGGFLRRKAEGRPKHIFLYFFKSLDEMGGCPGLGVYFTPPPSPLAKPSTASHPQRFRLGLRTS